MSWIYYKNKKHEYLYEEGKNPISLYDKWVVGHGDIIVKILDREIDAARICNYLNGGDGKIDMFMEKFFEEKKHD